MWAPRPSPAHRRPVQLEMKNYKRSPATELLVSLLGLTAALSLGIVLLGRLFDFLPLFYASAFASLALHVLSSRAGVLFLRAPLGRVVALPEGAWVLCGKMYHFQQRPLMEPMTVRVGWWQHKLVRDGSGLRSYYMFFHQKTRYALATDSAAANC